MLFWFKSKVEWNATLNGSPKIIIGQLLAIEPWVPNFVLGMDVVKIRGGNWVRLSRIWVGSKIINQNLIYLLNKSKIQT